MTPEMIGRLRSTLDEAGAAYEAEVYPGTFHGFAVADAGYDATAAERHWTVLVDFLRRQLVPREAS